MIEAKGLTKRYGDRLAVDGISFTAKQGEIVGLLGPNGAGKTTTMRMLTGFMPPTTGSAQIAGHDIVEDSLEARRNVGYLPERVPLYPDMTVRGYVTFWAKLRGVKASKPAVDAALARFHLTDRQNQLVRHLSKGLKQRLGLAQALVHNPPVIILDEPTIGIDPQQVIEVRDAVRALGQDHTVLFSTHILSEAEQVCDRVLIINHGKIVAQGKPADLRRQLQPGSTLYVVTRGADKKKMRDLLASVPGVTHVEGSGDGFTVKANTDVRGELSTHISAAGVTLLEMRPVTTSLEDVFLELVKEG
ncbi:MAG: ABC transporter ATP-binding protein [Anaerolineae bacterium]|nr:ABC transporter ATP-binding protein [Chloroflexota bacterium]MBN8634554.1 ABC transporter ATP-binding protein [Anaerolineae bacterium]